MFSSSLVQQSPGQHLRKRELNYQCLEEGDLGERRHAVVGAAGTAGLAVRLPLQVDHRASPRHGK